MSQKKKSKVGLKVSIFLIIAILIAMAVIEFYAFTRTETKEISKKPAYLFETPIYAIEEDAPTVQQGNLVIYANSKITSTPENGGVQRTTFSTGDTIIFKIQFNKVLASQSSAQILFKFGDGSTHTATPTVSGSELVFQYTITNPDTGLLTITGIKGSVTDKDGKTTQIGLGGDSYIQTSKIIADTTAPTLNTTVTWKDDAHTKLHVKVECNEKIYIIEGNKIKALASNTIKDCLYLTFDANNKTFRERGSYRDYTITTQKDTGKTTVEFDYVIDEGDIGKVSVRYLNICDIAGNKYGKASKAFDDINIGRKTKIPEIQNYEISVGDKKEVNGKKYLKAGDSVTATINYNETIYESVEYKDNYKTINRNAKSTSGSTIKIKIGNTEKNAQIVSVNGATIQFRYTIEAGDNGTITAILPGGLVKDKVGHSSSSEEKTVDGVIVDTVAPTVTGISVKSTGIYKAENDISYTITFSEDVGNGSINTTFSESTSQTTAVSTTGGFTKTKTVTYKTKTGDNGSILAKISAGAFKDYAGNAVVAKEIGNSNLYADTTGPTITITPATKQTKESKIKYTIELQDNSSNWSGKNSDGTSFAGGIAANTLDVDEIKVTNGTIIGSKKNDKGNISEITVLNENDGKQKVYIGAKKVYDVAKTGGNPNSASSLCDTVVVDTKKPQITSITVSPLEWTNQDVKITVQATDETTGVAGYSFNGAAYTTSNTATVSQNVNGYVIKVKDGVGNEVSQTINITNIDKVKPTLTATLEQDKIKITASDDLSGLKVCKVNGVEIELSNGAYTYTVTENGKYIITAVDNANNIASKEIEVTTIDKVPPQITNVEKEISDWTNQDVKLIVYAIDDYSGIAAKGYSFDGGKTWQESNVNSFSENQTVHIQVKDKNGNITSKDVEITNIDKDKPKVEVEPNDKIIKITATDELSGIARCEINGTQVTLTENVYEYEVTEDGNYIITVTDKAGNTETKQIEVTGTTIDFESDEEIEKIEKNQKQYLILSKEFNVEGIKNKFKEIKDIKIVKSNSEERTEGNVVTGDKIIRNKTEYTIILKGDIDCNGKIDIDDMFKLNKYRLGKQELTDIEMLAGDANEDGKVDIDDMFLINKYRLKKVQLLKK